MCEVGLLSIIQMSRLGGAPPSDYDSPLSRRKRGAAPGRSANCIEVQWRFLAKSPTNRSAIAGKNATNQLPSPSSARREPSCYSYRTTPVDASPQSTESSRVLDGLLGETQRQAALDRIMAEMHDLVAQPNYHLDSQNHAEDSQSHLQDRRKHSAAPGAGDLLEHLKSGESGAASLNLLPQRKRSALGIIADSRLTTEDDDDDDDSELDTSNKDDARDSGIRNEASSSFCSPTGPARSSSPNSSLPRRRWKSNCGVESDNSPTIVWQRSSTARFAADLPRLLDGSATSSSSKVDSIRSPAEFPSPPSASRAAYGAWYVPHHQWWPLHQLQHPEQSHAAPASRASTEDPHCHHGPPSQRQHKPPLPAVASASPRALIHPHFPASSSPASSPASSTASASPAPASASGLELQLAASYIGREYRSFVLASGSSLPHYLQ